MFKQIARAGLTLVAAVVASTGFCLPETLATPGTTVADRSPAPAPTSTPNPLTSRGYFRAYDFTRQNASSLPSGPTSPNTKTANQQSENNAISLHGDYRLGDGFSVGATYVYAQPFGGCANASDFALIQTSTGPKNPPCKNATPPALNPDYTLPPYVMSTLYEAYVAYARYGFTFKGGNQVLNSPWAPPSDSRLKPSAFSGLDATYAINRQWTVEGTYVWAFEDRADNGFTRSTLLTSFPIDAAGAPANINFGAGGQEATNSGFIMGKAGYTNGLGFTADAYYYGFSDIANMFWLDGKYAWKTPLKPFVALQYGTEKNAGTSLIGKLDSQVLGLQGGISLTPNVTLTANFDTVPAKSDTLNLAGSGISCNTPGTPGFSAAKPGDELSVPKGTSLNYFIPQGQPNCRANADGTTSVYYGGWASPYTDSYATDPLFTTSISQGMADRRNFGSSGKLALGFVSDNKQFVATISRAYYGYGNATVGVTPTQETNIDAMYYFSKIPKTGSYRGLLLRHRYAERTEQFTEAYTGTPLFKYNRTQLEYDF